VGFAIDSLFSFPQERIEHSLYFTLMCGIILGLYYNFSITEKRKDKAVPKWATGFAIAIAAFNIFIGIKKYNFEIHLNRAMGYDKAQQYDQVLEEVNAGKNSFVTLDPVAKSIEIYSSSAYQKQGKYDSALFEAAVAKKHNPNSYMVYNNIGTIFTDMKQYEKAVTYYNLALKLTPKFEMSLFNLAVNYFELKKYKECIETLNKVNWQKDEYLKSVYNEATARLNMQQQPYAIK
jgi:tetratricopeptide (TPR) repeat protein